MIRLYPTGETHTNGGEIFRKVGHKPREGRYGLGGKYFVSGDKGKSMYECGSPYMDMEGCHDGEPLWPLVEGSWVVVEVSGSGNHS